MYKTVLLGYAFSIFLLTSCAKTELSELAASDSPLQFSAYVGKQQTKAAEFNNASWTEGNNFVLRSYMQKEEGWATFFSDNLVLSEGIFALEGSQRFNIPYPTQFIAIYPNQDTYDDSAADFNTTYPYFSFEADGETDLMAAVQNHEALATNIQIPFHHLLTQVNFGIYECPGAKITISDIRIGGLNSSGIYTLSRGNQAPGYWTQAIPVIQAYTYSFGQGNTFTTTGSSDTYGYIFGDGGVFAPDNSGIPFKYVFNNGIAYAKEDAGKPTDHLSNALMLLPHSLEQLEDRNATIFFKYSITDLDNNPIGANTLQNGSIRLADLNIGWEPNYRYVYILRFNVDGDVMGFNVNVASYEN